MTEPGLTDAQQFWSMFSLHAAMLIVLVELRVKVGILWKKYEKQEERKGP